MLIALSLQSAQKIDLDALARVIILGEGKRGVLTLAQAREIVGTVLIELAREMKSNPRGLKKLLVSYGT